MLLGEALVPLQPLLTQPWIDGYELERALKPKGELPCVIM